MGKTFSRQERLVRSTDIRTVMRHGRRTRIDGFTIRWLSRPPGQSPENARIRFGAVISKRAVRLANRRNRMKRLLREFFRLNRHAFRSGGDLIIQVDLDQACRYRDLEMMLTPVLKKIGLWQ